jgi:hypothetical protein
MTRAGTTKRAAVVLLASACSSRSAHPPGGGVAPACETLRPKLERLYRAEAEVKEPTRIDEAVSDNTTMVLNDCARAPDRVARCVEAAASIAEIESKCVLPLDEEGSEGLELAR